jgi:predicted nucleotidyltransferase
LWDGAYTIKLKRGKKNKMQKFKSKDRALEYIRRKFSKNELILIRGSTANGSIKNFSDIDVEVYGELKKPCYELIFTDDKLVLITAYFYEYKEGEKIKSPKNVRVLKGEYNINIEKSFHSPSHFAKDTYSSKQKIIRETQLAMDFMFKYLRTKDTKYLESVQKRI